MKLSPKIRFDKNTFKFIGFTDIGRYMPEQQKDQHGDYSLVFLYQPFQGSWIQSIACFLSKGAANGHVLTQLVMESVVLIENTGFFVDAIVTDGAQWNRGMWTEYGITTSNPSCQHVVDEIANCILSAISLTSLKIYGSGF